MKLMPIPDENFQDMLREYGADTADHGFTDTVLAEIKSSSEKEEKFKRTGIIAAIGFSAVIAGLQFQGFIGLLDSFSLGSLWGGLTLPIGAITAMMMAVWLMEQRDVSL